MGVAMYGAARLAARQNLAAADAALNWLALSAPQAAQAVPQGWKLVPDAPTPEWIEAIVAAGGVRIGSIESVIEDVLAAAPSAPTVPPWWPAVENILSSTGFRQSISLLISRPLSQHRRTPMNEIKLPELPSWTAKYVIPENDDLSGAQFLDDALIAFARAAVTEDRAQRASLEAALHEWSDKTMWVQQTCQPRELGMHRADVLKARIVELEAKLAEAQKDAARYRWLRGFNNGSVAIVEITSHDADDWVVLAGWQADAATDADMAAARDAREQING